MFPKFTMRSSTCSTYKHFTFIPYALANVVEDEGDFTMAEGHGHPLVYIMYTRHHFATINCNYFGGSKLQPCGDTC
jgi:hypothetical protein